MLLIHHLSPKVDLWARASIVLSTCLTVTESADAVLAVDVNCLLGRAWGAIVRVQSVVLTRSVHWVGH